MFAKRIFTLVTAFVLLLGAGTISLGAEVDCDTVYCFVPEDFSGEESLAGICITELPEEKVGTMMLGTRILRPGDILTADQLAQMTFSPLRSQEDQTASVTFLPIYEDRVAPTATMTIAIRGKEDKAPIAEDFAAETYKNLPVSGRLKVKEPENQAMTYTVTRNPKRGQVEIKEDGSFTYTPKKNKVGIDSFRYTATDESGNASREATVTITIVKPTDATQYTDTIGKDCRFAAEWMKNTGIFVGEKLDGNACFSPDKEVTRGEFLTMLVKTLDIPTEEQAALAHLDDQVPTWLQPYLAAAVRSGLTAGLPDSETFGAHAPITGAEAALMIQNALDLSGSSDAETLALEEAPDWACAAIGALRHHGIILDSDATLTRAQTAQVLYQVDQIAETAPGMRVIRAAQ